MYLTSSFDIVLKQYKNLQFWFSSVTVFYPPAFSIVKAGCRLLLVMSRYKYL